LIKNNINMEVKDEAEKVDELLNTIKNYYMIIMEILLYILSNQLNFLL
jgi:hypothetical protein